MSRAVVVSAVLLLCAAPASGLLMDALPEARLVLQAAGAVPDGPALLLALSGLLGLAAAGARRA